MLIVLPRGNLPPPELFNETQTLKSQTLQEKGQPSFPTDWESTGVCLAIYWSCCLCFSPWPLDAPGPTGASGPLVMVPTPGSVQLRAQQPGSREGRCRHSLYRRSSSFHVVLRSLTLSPLSGPFLPWLLPGEPSQKWVQEPKAC